MLKIVPVGHRILIKMKTVEEVSAGGIIMSVGDGLEREKYSQAEGTVVGIGSQAFKDLGDGTPWCKEGDVVYLNKYSGIHITDPETKEVYRIVNDQDVMGVVRS